jgi:hypothetical protein
MQPPQIQRSMFVPASLSVFHSYVALHIVIRGVSSPFNTSCFSMYNTFQKFERLTIQDSWVQENGTAED